MQAMASGASTMMMRATIGPLKKKYRTRAPTTPPEIWAAMYTGTSRHGNRRNDASMMVMAGLKCAPLTVPDTTTITVMAKPKAMLSSNSPYAPVVMAVATVIRPTEASRNTAPNSANACFHYMVFE
jgi:hypothetical protein